jgi:serine/threonine-protein kinase
VSQTVLHDGTEDRLGKYRLLAVLARGGMGDVYLAAADAVDGFSKLLVVKELRREQADDEVYVNMFMDEARLAARLNHPNIVQTIEVGSDGARRFLVMEYLDGQSLHRTLRRARRDGHPFSAELHVRVLTDVLEALAYSHALTDFGGNPLGIVHRDVSPQNVFLTYEGQVKLIDFGIAKTRLASQQTSAGVLKGKIRYMAPEQATGQAMDHRTDIFSLGVMLWEALVGHGPWEGQSDLQVLQGLMSDAIPRLRDRPRDLPPHLVAITDRAMSPAPADRYPTARAMRDDLLHCLPPAPGGGHANDLRELVSRLFADERRSLGAIVDAQLRGTGVDAPSRLVSLTRVRTQARGGESDGHIEAAPPSSGRSSPLSAAAGAASPMSAMPISEPIQERPSLLKRGARLSGAVLAAASAVMLVRAMRSAPRPVPPVTDAPAPAMEAQVAAPFVSEVAVPPTAHVTVRTLPATAKLYVDNVLVNTPYAADFVRNDTVHQLRVEAPGHITKTRTFTPATDIDLEISLDRDPGRRRSAQPPEAPARPAPLGAGAGASTSSGSGPKSDCDPNFYFDAQGRKHFKPECFLPGH